MNKWIRTLSMLVCMALLMTTVPVGAMSDEISADAQAVEVIQLPEETPEELHVEFEQAEPEEKEITQAEPEEEDTQAEASAPADAAEDEAALQEMTFMDVISELNSAEESAAAVKSIFSVDELRLEPDTGLNLYEEEILPEPKADEEYVFTTTDELVAYVDEYGVLHAKFTGEVVIGLSVNGGEEMQLKVKVASAAADQLAPTVEQDTIGVGMRMKITANQAGGYSVEGSAVKVAQDGTVIGQEPGEAVVVFTGSESGETASVVVTVLPVPQPEQVSIAATEMVLQPGESFNLNASYAEGTMCTFAYESSNPDAVKVDDLGNVTAVSGGEAVITVWDRWNLFSYELARCSVFVGVEAEEIAFAQDTLKIGKGDTFDLKQLLKFSPESSSAELSFSSSKKSYATVTEDGIVKGVKKGSANITVKTDNGLSAKIKVTVSNLATASKISFSPKSLELGLGNRENVNVKFSSGYHGLYTLESSDENVILVEDGRVFARNVGSAEVVLRLVQKPSVEKRMKVTVKEAPRKIEASEAKLMLAVGQSSSAVYGVNPDPEHTKCGFVYSTTDTDVITVDENTGKITAVGKGRGYVTIKADNSTAYAECAVTVVEMKESSLKIGVGDICDLKQLIGHPDGDGLGSYTFSSGNKKIAAVNADGLVKGMKAGSANITIKSGEGLSVKVKVTVSKYATASKLKVNPGEITLGVGMSAPLEVKFSSGYYGLYEIVSNNPDVVEVTADGRIHALSVDVGTVTVRLVKNPEVFKTVWVKVLPAPDAIHASADALKLVAGQVSDALYGVNLDENTMCAYIYESDNEAVVKVDAETGELTAVSEGSAVITIHAGNNAAAKAYCAVEVLRATENLALRESTISIGKGDTFDIRRLIEIDDGSAAAYTFSTSAKSYATVNADGIIKGVKKGSATITVKTHNGLTAKLKVKVLNLATASKLKLSPAEITLGEGMTEKLKVSFSSGYYGIYNVASDADGVAYVDVNGNIVATAPGEAVLTVSLVQKPAVYKTVKVTVLPAPERIEASTSELVLGVNQESDALYGLNPDAYSTLCDFIYESSNPDCVQVDAFTGKLVALNRGESRITITAGNNPAAQAVCDVTVLDAPLSIALRKESLTIGKGDTFDLAQLIELPEGSAAGFSFSTSSKSYVKVNADGVITGVKKGSATITVKTHNGLSNKIKVTVKSAPGAVYLDCAALNLGVGMRAQLNVRFASSSYFSLYTIESSQPDVASVDANGVVTGHKQGSTVITVTTQNGKTASCTVSVLAPTTSIEFEQDSYRISEGMQLTAGLVVDEYSLDEYIFASGDDETVFIDENGVLRGLKKGSAQISVVTGSGVANTRVCTVEVTAAPAMLDYDSLTRLVIPKSYTMELPEPFIMDADGNEVPANISYAFTKSSHSEYAKISGDTVTGLKAGTAVVRAYSHNGKTADFTLEVVNDTIRRVELDHSEYRLYISDTQGDSVALDGFVMGDTVSFGRPEYVSDHPEIASVSEDGIVTAVAPGVAVITAYAYDGTSASCHITVGRLTGSISFAEEEMMLTEGDTFQLEPVFDEGCGARVWYESGNPAVAVVDEISGLVTAMQPGTAELIVTTHSGLEARLNLKVRALPEGMYFRVAGLNLVVGDDVLLKPVLQKSDLLGDDILLDESVSYVSSDETIAKVDADGTVTALREGSAVITASTRNGLSAECAVNILAEGSTVKTEFAFDSATMIKGDTAELQFNLSADAFEHGFTIESADPDKLLVDDRNWTITATGAAPEGIELILTVNPDPDEVASVPQSVRCVVKIIEQSGIAFSADEITLQRSGEGSSASLEIYNLPEDLIGTFELFVVDPTIAAYDMETGVVQAIDLSGETRVICRVFDCEISCVVRVGRSYRALIISEYNNSKYTTSNLPFAAANVRNIRDSLEMSLVDGETYDITVLSSNPTQAQIKAAISSTFADACEGDVSLVYIVSHGYYNKDGIEGYCFGTPGWDPSKPDTYITSDELFGWLSGIEGNVVLMLDSCKSGGFLRDTKAQLEADGDIAVITAQAFNKNASYFVKSDGSSIEFMTYVLCAAFGLDYEYETYNGDLKADANGDGEVTLGECFKYTKSQTTSLVKSKLSYFKAGSSKGFLVPGVKTQSQLNSWGSQTPQYFIPSGMDDLVIFAS